MPGINAKCIVRVKPAYASCIKPRVTFPTMLDRPPKPPRAKRARGKRVYQPRVRLIEARLQRFSSAADAARAMGVPIPTYNGHENGSRGLGRSGARYAKFFGVSMDWLIRGKGSMRGSPAVLLTGVVGAGAVVDFAPDDDDLSKGEWIPLPKESEARALVVTGDSMWPLFQSGEFVLYDPIARLPKELVDRYAIVVLSDGSKKIKMLRASERPGLWTLESHNAKPEGPVELQHAYRYLGKLPPK